MTEPSSPPSHNPPQPWSSDSSTPAVAKGKSDTGVHLVGAPSAAECSSFQEGDESPEAPPRKRSAGHTRSASHVGVPLQNVEGSRTLGYVSSGTAKPSAFSGRASSLKGHHRTLSQGQVTEGAHPPRGHKREGSRTEFILPEGHEERERERRKKSHRRTGSGSGTWKKGHKRQASHTESVYSIRNQKKSLWQKICFWRKTNHERNTRLVVPNHIIPQNINNSDHPNHSYAKNKICTRKYTLFTFLPKNLFEQFHRFANLYFLFICLLNFVPSVNAFAPALSMLPLIFVLGVTAVKDIFEDYRRYVSDRDVNFSTCRVYSGTEGRYIQKTWREVTVGDILHLSCDEIIPADLVLLNASDSHGVCYIESSNLDGEINLKQRQCIRGIARDENFDASQFTCMLEVGPPTTKMYHFVGTLVSHTGEQIALTKDNIIPRDCLVKNTDFVEGIVVYAGKETKALLNNGGPRYKRSKLEQMMNREVLWCVIILLFLCVICAIGAGWHQSELQSYSTGPIVFVIYDSITRALDDPALETPAWIAFTSFWSFIIVFQVVIPISLYVTIEIIKLLQVYHIQSDEHFYNDKQNKSMRCRALNMNEELGQVQYIFADKTGTLTENKMVFQRCSINGVDYCHEPLLKEDKVGLVEDSFNLNTDLLQELTKVELQSNSEYNRCHTNSSSYPESLKTMRDFFITLAACNTIVVTKNARQDTMTATGAVIPKENSKEKKSRTPSISLPFGLPFSNSTGSKGLIRSLFPSSRPLSPIAASPTATPPVTPQESPRHSSVTGASLQPDCINPFFEDQQFNGVSSYLAPPNTETLQIPRPNNLPLSTFNDEISLASSITPVDYERKPFYEAESPDELALVNAAYTYGYRLLQRSIYHISLVIPGYGLCELEILHVLPFDSDRKRMSIIVRHPDTGQKTLFCKGADNAILENLSSKCKTPENSHHVDRLSEHLDMYSKKGLRVLCMARRTLKDAEYEAWAIKHKEAANSLANREKKLFQSYCEIETDMELLGATGIEDCLQDGVPETIHALKKAGIVIYVLTGDKQETAINIAYSCTLFSSDMSILKLNASNLDETRKLINSFLKKVEREGKLFKDSYESAEFSAINRALSDEFPSLRERRTKRPRWGLVVDGRTLIFILDGRTNLRTPFIKLSQHCETVLCCRATPLQKALIVRNIKDKLDVLTLAIGDGANDVSMIQTANVGIGISGVEGRQAVMASDFSITRFSHLERLLLVHGHWSYDRLCRIILYFFYKNAAVVFMLMWFQIYCGFSGSIIIEQLFLTMFSLLFTAFPPIAVGVYNKDAPEEVLLAEPQLYSVGRHSQLYRPSSFWINILDAFYQSVIVLFIPVLAYEYNETGFYELGMTVCHISLVSQLLHLAIETSNWTFLKVGIYLFSYVFYILFSVFYTVILNGGFDLPSMRGEYGRMLGSSTHWISFFISIVLALLPRFIFRAMQNSFFPSDVMKAVIKSRCQNEGLFLEKNSKASSSSSVYRFDPHPLCSREEDERTADPLSSLVTMTTIVSTHEDNDASEITEA